MLLPKRLKRRMIKNGENPTEKLLRKLISLQFPEEVDVLDEKNAIVVFRDNENALLVHYRLLGGKLIKVSQKVSFSYDYFEDKFDFINQLSLLKRANNREDFSLTYKYKNGSYIIKDGIWNTITFEGKNGLFKKYRCALGMIKIASDYENDDNYSFINPVTEEKVTETFEVNDGNYYAILNLDGTIRGNKLFKGNSFSKVEEIIDLNDYESLETFIEERKNICNEIKQRNKQYYMEMIAEKNNGSNSPYLDSEVLRILKMKK